MKIKSYRRTIKKNAGLFAITDIVLNIFIFFFITFNLAGTLKSEMESHMTDIDVPHESDEPPKESTEPPPEPIIPLEVLIRGVHPNGELLLQLRDSSGMLKRVTLHQLTGEIEKQPLEETEEQQVPSVIIIARHDIAYDYVIKVLDAVKAARKKENDVLVPKYKKNAVTTVLDFKSSTQ